MIYERTPEIRKKQSETMKIVSSNIDQKKKVSKWRKSLSDSNKKIGRKPKYQPITKKCNVCKKDFLCVKRYDILKRVYCSSKCYYESRIGIAPIPVDICKNIDRSYMKTEKYSLSKQKEHTPEFKRYRNKVQNLSEKSYVKYQHVINPNNVPRTLAGVDGGWQLDHIITVKEGFEKGYTAEEISDYTNLRMLPWKINLNRNKKNYIL